jgi:hypothetical protein
MYMVSFFPSEFIDRGFCECQPTSSPCNHRSLVLYSISRADNIEIAPKNSFEDIKAFNLLVLFVCILSFISLRYNLRSIR